MRPILFTRLCAIARRECGDAGLAEDVVQEALLAAVRAGRTDLGDPQTGRWLGAVVRNQARLAIRTQMRRRSRDTRWQREALPAEPADAAALDLSTLPPALRIVAALVLSGHNRREIAHLLRLSDATLRQRVAGLKQRLRAAGVPLPREFVSLNLDLAYGRIREALLPALLRQSGVLASHDPDGHLFVITSSRNGGQQQLPVSVTKEGKP